MNVLDNRCITESYRYQWMDEAQQTLRKRWDNVEHFPNLPNFPHHVHIGEESNVEGNRTRALSMDWQKGDSTASAILN